MKIAFCTHSCVWLFITKATCPATKFCWSLLLLCMESGSCAEDEHDWQRCPSVVYPESSASATAVPATGIETESGPKKQGGAAATPGEREQERQIPSLCMCVYRQNQSDLNHFYSDQIHNTSSGFTYASQKHSKRYYISALG